MRMMCSPQCSLSPLSSPSLPVSGPRSHSSKTTLITLPAEIVLGIADYFYDDYVYDKPYLGPSFTYHLQSIPRPGELDLDPADYLIRPYTAMAMTCRRLWDILPRKLRRPISLETVGLIEGLQHKENWARPFAKERGWEYVELDNKRDD